HRVTVTDRQAHNYTRKFPGFLSPGSPAFRPPLANFKLEWWPSTEERTRKKSALTVLDKAN
ncbi:hypothetical protein BaRGS_00008325, partial [Batillaria attramentaria]